MTDLGILRSMVVKKEQFGHLVTMHLYWLVHNKSPYSCEMWPLSLNPRSNIEMLDSGHLWVVVIKLSQKSKNSQSLSLNLRYSTLSLALSHRFFCLGQFESVVQLFLVHRMSKQKNKLILKNSCPF